MASISGSLAFRLVRPAVAAAVVSGLLVLTAAALGPATVVRAADTHTVTIEDDAFEPAAITVDVGDTVLWNQESDTVHTVTSEGNWDSGDLGENESFAFTFTRAGTFEYFSRQDENMRGTIVVGVPAPSPSAPPFNVPNGAMRLGTGSGTTVTLLGAALVVLGSGGLAARLAVRRR